MNEPDRDAATSAPNSPTQPTPDRDHNSRTVRRCRRTDRAGSGKIKVQDTLIQSEPRAYELRDYVRMMRSYWAGAVVVMLIALTAAGAWTLTQAREFSSTASGVVQVASSGDANMSFAADQLAKSQAESYVELGKSAAVAKRAAKSIGFDGSPTALLGRVSSTLADNTAIITVHATAATPKDAAALASTWITAMGDQIAAVQKEASGAVDTSTTKFLPLASATVPTAPSSPNVPAALAVGALAGLVLAFVYVLARNTLDRRIRNAAVVEREFGLSVLGTIPMNPLLVDEQRLVVTLSNDGADARHLNFSMLESLRELRTNLSYVHVDEPPRIMIVTSAQPGDGKSTVAANLAETLAASTTGRVVVIDCDLRRPTISKIFGVSGGAGLTDVLAGRAELADVMQQTDVASNLWVIGAGRIPPNPSELLGSDAMKTLLNTIAAHATIVLDAPPVLAVTDAVVLSKHADGVLVTMSARRTTIDLLRRTLQLLERGGATVLGGVLNRVPVRGADARDYGYYGGRYYYYESNAETAPTEGVHPEAKAATRPVLPDTNITVAMPDLDVQRDVRPTSGDDLGDTLPSRRAIRERTPR